MFQNKNKKFNNQRNSGFSLFELLVVISISAVIASITFSGFPKMNSKLSLDLLAQDIAMSLRQAQVYGTTVYSAGDSTSDQTWQAYGVSFPSRSFVDSKGKYSYTLFADVTKSKFLPDAYTENRNYNRYNEQDVVCGVDDASMLSCLNNRSTIPGIDLTTGKENEFVQSFVLSGKDSIDKVCLNYFNDSNPGTKQLRVDACNGASVEQYCPGLSIPDVGASVDIIYRRPKLEATILTKSANEDCYPSNVGFIIKSESSQDYRVVVAWRNGQISVDK